MDNKDPKRTEVFEWRNCIEQDCVKKRFYISVAEKEYFDDRKMALPKRCYPCRVKRRNNGSHNHGN